jgi:hypothetical protein
MDTTMGISIFSSSGKLDLFSGIIFPPLSKRYMNWALISRALPVNGEAVYLGKKDIGGQQSL